MVLGIPESLTIVLAAPSLDRFMGTGKDWLTQFRENVTGWIMLSMCYFSKAALKSTELPLTSKIYDWKGCKKPVHSHRHTEADVESWIETKNITFVCAHTANAAWFFPAIIVVTSNVTQKCQRHISRLLCQGFCALNTLYRMCYMRIMIY